MSARPVALTVALESGSYRVTLRCLPAEPAVNAPAATEVQSIRPLADDRAITPDDLAALESVARGEDIDAARIERELLAEALYQLAVAA